MKESIGHDVLFGKPAKEPLPPLNTVKELALVVVAGTIICSKLVQQLPEGMQEQALDGIVDATERYINEYIQHHYGNTLGRDNGNV